MRARGCPLAACCSCSGRAARRSSARSSRPDGRARPAARAAGLDRRSPRRRPRRRPRSPARAHMSERNFARAFAREVGVTPAAYVERPRVEDARGIAAREPRAPSTTVAARAGFGTVETLRRAFHRRARREPRRLPPPLRPPAPRPPRGGDPMDIAIPLFDRFTALDAVGPYEVLSAAARARGCTSSPHEPARTRPTTACSRSWPTRALVRRRRARRARGARWHRHRARSRTTSPAGLDARGARDVAPGPRRCAPARCCSAPPGMLDGLRGHHATGSILDAARRVRRPADRSSASSEQGKVITGRGRVLGHRHGAHARRAHRRRRGGQGDPARHRVRPAAAVRLRLAAKARPELTELVRSRVAAFR